MNTPRSLADRIADGNESAAVCARGIIRLQPFNLVERPWGGLRMLEYKGYLPLPDQKRVTGMGIGESFETACCPSDPESDDHPSIACLPDGSAIPLPELMRAAGRDILGDELFARWHGEIPLLPKILDIEELLSIQAHPPGNTELYVIIDAEPGATIRLGFRHNIDAVSLRDELHTGRQTQQALLDLLRPDIDHHELQAILAPALADRDGDMAAVADRLKPLLRPGAERASLAASLTRLKAVYWHVLDLMNEIPVRRGQVIFNASPRRVCEATGLPPSAEVHALGNPQRREILMLEIRRPGVTFRAWDNVRFPVRDIDIDQTLAALHLGATSPEEFQVTPVENPDMPGVFRSVAGTGFAVDHIRPGKDFPVTVPAGHFQTLHAIEGCVELVEPNGHTTTLRAGESAIVPTTVASYRVESADTSEIICVSLPTKSA